MTPLSRVSFLLATAPLFISCGEQDGAVPLQAQTPRAASIQMPRLVEQSLPKPPVDDEPSSSAWFVALTTKGTISYRRDRGVAEVASIVTFDSTGKVLSRFGRRGEGPGEIHPGSATWLLADDARVLVTIPFLQLFTPQGKVLSERVTEEIKGMPLAIVGDSVDYVEGLMTTTGYRPGPIVRHCMYSACSRVLLPASDSILTLAEMSQPDREPRWPPFAAEPNRFVVGDGVGYRLWMFGNDGKLKYQFGRTLPPQRRTPRDSALRERELTALDREIMATNPRPPQTRFSHFTMRSLSFDEQHRLWVVGKVNDSTFFDVFADSAFLGRIVVDCFSRNGSVNSIRGHWAALLCFDEKNEEHPFTLRLFRITEK